MIFKSGYFIRHFYKSVNHDLYRLAVEGTKNNFPNKNKFSIVYPKEKMKSYFYKYFSSSIMGINVLKLVYFIF